MLARGDVAWRRRRLLGAAALACVLGGLALVLALPGGGAVPARASSAGAREDAYQTDDSVPAVEVRMMGASPGETAGETWGIGEAAFGSEESVLVRYLPHSGWARSTMLDSSGHSLAGFEPAPGALAGQMTTDGSGALAGFVKKAEVLLVRAPGGQFEETPPVLPAKEGEEPLLAHGEEMFDRQAPLVAPLEEGTSAGAFVVPLASSEVENPEPAVLHWEGQAKRWTREAVELPAGASAADFQALAIAASSPQNAWLLARLSNSEAVSLFRRQAGSEHAPASWKPVVPQKGQEPGAPLTVAKEEPITDSTAVGAQMLTATTQGLWVDGEYNHEGITLFFKPAGSEEASGEVQASWCSSEQENSEHKKEPVCAHKLPAELPSREYRSFAWASADPSTEPYGERVITGLIEGRVLRLTNEHKPEEKAEDFVEHATIGGPEEPDEVGASSGAAFSSAFEGWLGDLELPVHATLEGEPNQLEYWPAPFQRPLLSIAGNPSPEQPIAGEGSEALAVGENGQVARYVPEEGWQAEGLRNASGHVVHPQLHAVAWPTPGRAYAVGTSVQGSGKEATSIAEMWLWRWETKLWEPDPAAPVNLRANLLGIAFLTDGGQIVRGYVVGQGGALLRYGKTWTQEPICQGGETQLCLPEEVAGASFTSVAFAGSEALVAFRVPHTSKNGEFSYVGGVLANDGGGWRVDSEIDALLPKGFIPWGVAGLPDGGAAVSAARGTEQGLVLERQSASSSWEEAPPLGVNRPASLSLFRENGALRAIGAGAIPNTLTTDNQLPAPAGFPSTEIPPYPLPLGPGSGVIRQTATGWSDQEHENHILHPPPGGFLHWDIPYTPDPTATVLINEEGTHGWAVGGIPAARESAQTSDIARYPAQHQQPSGSGTYHVPLSVNAAPHTTLAVGGGSQCAAPCAALEHAKIGPDVWLEKALNRAHEIEGLDDFIYTGPRLTTGAASLPTTIPYEREFEAYESLIGTSPIETYVTPAETDRERDGSECAFDEHLFEQMHASPDLEHSLAVPRKTNGEEACKAGRGGYYHFTAPATSGGQPVRVIVLDDSGALEPTQLAKQKEWLEEELTSAKKEEHPAVVVGNANLREEDLGGDPQVKTTAEELTKAIVQGEASAYLFDAPEENIKTQLESGGRTVRAFGSGTLGYTSADVNQAQMFIRASGFLLIEVPNRNARKSNGEKEEVEPRLIPNIEELSLDAHKGTILHRSEAALFSALARRPRAGGIGVGQSGEEDSSNFVTLAPCNSGECEEAILPEYKFASSNAELGEFVEPNLESEPNGELPKLVNEELKPESKSGLFCALNATPKNAKGESIPMGVSVEAGGLKAELKVTIEAGSVRRPCGTVKTKQQPAATQEHPVTPPPLSPAPSTAPGGSPPILPVPPLPSAPVTPPPPPLRVPAPPLPFLLAPTPVQPVGLILPPPLPPVAEPTPPSGTSAVSSQVVEQEEEEEEATESVSAQASAYHQVEHEPSPLYLLALIAIAAFAGVGMRRRPRRGEREVRVAPATLSTMRSQRRMAPPRSQRRPPW